MKSKNLSGLILLLLVCFFSYFPAMAGEPVPGAEILIEQEPNDIPISLVQSNDDGEFTFTFPKGMKIPDKGVFKITVTPPSKLKGQLKKKLSGMEKQVIEVPFRRKDGPKFKYVITWDEKLKSKSNRGGFAVSGRNNA